MKPLKQETKKLWISLLSFYLVILANIAISFISLKYPDKITNITLIFTTFLSTVVMVVGAVNILAEIKRKEELWAKKK